MHFPTLKRGKGVTIELRYSTEFWRGLSENGNVLQRQLSSLGLFCS